MIVVGQGTLGGFLQYFVQHCFICRPSDFTESEDAGIEPRTVATLALEVRTNALITRLDLIHLGQNSSTSARSHPPRLDLTHLSQNSSTSARSHPSQLHLIPPSDRSHLPRLYLIHFEQISARSHPSVRQISFTSAISHPLRIDLSQISSLRQIDLIDIFMRQACSVKCTSHVARSTLYYSAYSQMP